MVSWEWSCRKSLWPCILCQSWFGSACANLTFRKIVRAQTQMTIKTLRPFGRGQWGPRWVPGDLWIFELTSEEKLQILDSPSATGFSRRIPCRITWRPGSRCLQSYGRSGLLCWRKRMIRREQRSRSERNGSPEQRNGKEENGLGKAGQEKRSREVWAPGRYGSWRHDQCCEEQTTACHSG